ncbi:MAG: hypothetical protein N3F07_03475 [Candidatus Micrarchaeota archaeon]|nr:hypothetical protein [Candidatus Micrarchaeota archaeon]
MRYLCAQASAELVSLMAISLLVVFMFSILAWNALSDADAQRDFNDAYQSVRALADAADYVYGQGEGASRIVSITIPSGADMGKNATYIGKPQGSSPSIEPKQITIRYGGNDISAYTSARLHGFFPPNPGTFNMEVVRKADAVLIQPNVIDVDAKSVAVVMPNGETRTVRLKVYKSASENVSVNVSFMWNYNEVSLSAYPASFSATYQGFPVVLSFSSSGAVAGSPFNGMLILTAAGQQSNASERVEIPISVSVRP